MNIYLLTHEVTIKILCMHFILAFLHFCSLFFFSLWFPFCVCRGVPSGFVQHLSYLLCFSSGNQELRKGS